MDAVPFKKSEKHGSLKGHWRMNCIGSQPFATGRVPSTRKYRAGAVSQKKNSSRRPHGHGEAPDLRLLSWQLGVARRASSMIKASFCTTMYRNIHAASQTLGPVSIDAVPAKTVHPQSIHRGTRRELPCRFCWYLRTKVHFLAQATIDGGARRAFECPDRQAVFRDTLARIIWPGAFLLANERFRLCLLRALRKRRPQR